LSNAQRQFITANWARIEALEDKFVGYSTNVTTSRIEHFLLQFPDEHMDIVLRLLENINYFDNNRVTQLVTQLGNIIRTQTNQNLENVYFCPVDDSTGSSGDWLLRRLRNDLGLGPRMNNRKFVHNRDLGILTVDERQAEIDVLERQLNAITLLPDDEQSLPNVTTSQKQLQSRLSNLQSTTAIEPRSIVFVDDMIGSGTTFLEFLEDSGSWYDENNNYFLATIVSHQKGIEKIQNTFDSIQIISVVNTIPDNQRLFHDDNTFFTPAEKGILKKYCNAVERSKLFRYGYKNSQSNVIFYERAPNNILPILYTNDNWYPLFPR